MSDLQEVPCTEKEDRVNSKQFWEQVEKEVIARGLTEGFYQSCRPCVTFILHQPHTYTYIYNVYTCI